MVLTARRRRNRNIFCHRGKPACRYSATYSMVMTDEDIDDIGWKIADWSFDYDPETVEKMISLNLYIAGPEIGSMVKTLPFLLFSRLLMMKFTKVMPSGWMLSV